MHFKILVTNSTPLFCTMNRLLFLMLFVLCCHISIAQTDNNAPYWKNKNIPAFRLVAIKDSSFFSETDLAKNKITMFILFNPECEHCQQQFKMLVKLAKVKKDAQVVLASTETWEKISRFNIKYEIGKYPFVTLCKDTKFTFGSFFQPKTVPVIAIYNKKGQFEFIKQGEIKKKELEAVLLKL